APRGTPIAEIGAPWSSALARAMHSLDARAALRLVFDGSRGTVRVSGLRAVSASGARLAFDGDGLSYGWPGGGTRFAGQASVSGGGLPTSLVTLRQARPGGPVSGLAHIAPYGAGSARLSLADIAFSASPDGSTAV